MDFDTIMVELNEKITTSLFCCIVKYLDGEVGSLNRKNRLLLEKALDSMVLAINDLLVPNPLIQNRRAFGVLMPTVENLPA